MLGKVILARGNKIYVEVGDNTHKIQNPFGYQPKEVELVEVEGRFYIKGYEPKKEPKQKKEVTNVKEQTSL